MFFVFVVRIDLHETETEVIRSPFYAYHLTHFTMRRANNLTGIITNKSYVSTFLLSYLKLPIIRDHSTKFDRWVDVRDIFCMPHCKMKILEIQNLRASKFGLLH